MLRDKPQLKICMIAGEASGDLLGSRLITAIKKEISPDVELIGVGGPLMEEEGLKSIFPMQDLSVMGIVEVVPRLPKILRRIEQTVRLIEQEKPDIVVTIDSPDFCFRVAKAVKDRLKQPPRMVHYVAPTVWAWRPERAKKVAAIYDGIMCLYPFEPDYFSAEGMSAAFVGHSVMESGFDKGRGNAFKAELEVGPEDMVLGVLFGSRMGELNRMGPLLREVIEKFSYGRHGLHVLSPTLPHLERQVRNLLQGLSCPVHVITDDARKWDCFSAMDKALATSGTVGLELAVAGVPHLIAYKMNPVTWSIVKRKVNVRFAHLANILTDEQIVPEFIQGGCNAGEMANVLGNLDAGSQKQQFGAVRQMLAGSNDNAPSVQAATYLRDLIGI